MGSNYPPFTFRREIDASPETVYDAFAKAEKFEQWWGAKGFTIQLFAFEFVPEGACHYAMVSDSKNIVLYGKFIYKEMKAPFQLEYISGFADENGNIISTNLMPDWPQYTHSILRFELQNGKTLLTGISTPIEATPNEEESFFHAHEQMLQGLSGTLDKLDAFLKQN